MQLDFYKLTDLSYLLDPNPPYQFSGLWLLLGLFLILLSGALLVTFLAWQPWQRAIPKRLSTPLWTTSLVGLILLFGRHQSIPYLSTRALLLFMILVSLIYIGYSLSVTVKEMRQAKEEAAKVERFRKYLPRKKR